MATQLGTSHSWLTPAFLLLGLVSFAGTATTVVPPTTDREAVRSALATLRRRSSVVRRIRHVITIGRTGASVA